jgi:hypothetical protein
MVVDALLTPSRAQAAPVRFRFGVVQWQPQGGLEGILADILAHAGHTVLPFAWNAPLPEAVDVVLACGPFGSLAPISHQLSALPPPARPRLVWWLTEQLPNPAWPAWLVRGLGATRAWLEQQAFRPGTNGLWRSPAALNWIVQRANRLRYAGDLRLLTHRRLLSLVVVGSGLVAAALRAQGLNPLHATLGVPRAWWDDLGLERDIAVLWLGNPATPRRRRLLTQLQTDLRARGLDLMRVDSLQHPFVFGQARTALLNRTQIVVNFVREPWDNNGLRYFLAAANGALNVSEPTLPHTPFVPGQHLVEAPPVRMAEVIAQLINHPAQRDRLAAAGQHLARVEHSTERGVARLLHRLDPAAAGAQPP